MTNTARTGLKIRLNAVFISEDFSICVKILDYYVICTR